MGGSVMIAAIEFCRQTAYTHFSLYISVNTDFKFSFVPRTCCKL